MPRTFQSYNMESKRRTESKDVRLPKRRKLVIEVWEIILLFVIGTCFANATNIPRVCKSWNSIYGRHRDIKIARYLKNPKRRQQYMMLLMADLCQRGILTRFFIMQKYKCNHVLGGDSKANLSFWSAEAGKIKLCSSYFNTNWETYEGSTKYLDWAKDTKHLWFLNRVDTFLRVHLAKSAPGFVLQFTHVYNQEKTEFDDGTYRRTLFKHLDEQGVFPLRETLPGDRIYEKITLIRGLPEDDIFWSMVGRSKAMALRQFEDCAADPKVPYYNADVRNGNVIPFDWLDKVLGDETIMQKVLAILKKYNKELKLY